MPRKSGTQSKHGKAFEYACLMAFYKKYNELQKVDWIKSDAVETAKKDFESLLPDLKNNLESGASAAVRIIERLEPKLQYPEGEEPLYLSIQADAAGQAGDVRDVLCIRKQNGWQIGLSCKLNHEAVKHPRLSDKLDFGNKWFGYPCSQEYFDSVKTIFQKPRNLAGQKRGKPYLWEELPDKEKSVYKPVLNAFIKELKRLYTVYPDVPEKLVKYLMGRYDFYKVIADEGHRLTKIEAVNLSGTLNQKAGSHKSITTVPVMKLPTKFYNIGFLENSNTTIIIGCNNGWEISMRIHNASSKVEPSLKFDVQLVSAPGSVYIEMEPWDK